AWIDCEFPLLRMLLPVTVFLTAWLMAEASASAVTIREMYSFPSVPSVQATLAEGSDGAYYGTTTSGGGSGLGSVFRVTTNGLVTTLVSFTGSNGAVPSQVLAKGNEGAFYGTTSRRGPNGYGTIFRVTQHGELSTVAAFAQTTGFSSFAGLRLGNDGACAQV